MTGQLTLDSYENTGLRVALELVNALALGPLSKVAAIPEALRELRRVLRIDPPSLAALGPRDVPRFIALSRELRRVFADFATGDVDAAAERLNGFLARHPAHPHLAKEDGVWRLHHHPADMALVPMWTAICAEAMARMVGEGHAHRFGICSAPGCDRAFFDVSRNATRRFCSTTCQNRVKAAAFRRRRGER